MSVELEERPYGKSEKYYYWASENNNIEVFIFPTSNDATYSLCQVREMSEKTDECKFVGRADWCADFELDGDEYEFNTSVQQYYRTLEEAKNDVIYLLSALSIEVLIIINHMRNRVSKAEMSQGDLDNIIAQLAVERDKK